MATPGPLSVVATFDPAAAELPESVTLDDDDNLYATDSLLGVIWKISPCGTVAPKQLAGPARAAVRDVLHARGGSVGG